jgi:hypothetical protein
LSLDLDLDLDSDFTGIWAQMGTRSLNSRIRPTRRSVALRLNYGRDTESGEPSRQPAATHIEAMHLDLTDEQTAALTQELHDIVENDRYPFSPRIRTLRGILNKLRPEPVREPLPPRRVYAPPRAAAARRRRSGH